MIIGEAKSEELSSIMAFYDMMCVELGKASFLPEGNKKGFPSKEIMVNTLDNANCMSELRITS